MCGNFPNIKVVEGNAFSLVLPLKRRTFESCQPIDEDIDATQLTDVVVKFGGVEYTPSLGVDGVTIILPATLARGTYDIVLTAKYQGTDIRAAYESAISIVPWNSQSDAQQFVPGSPIVCDAAYVIGGALTDAELEALKEQYREAIADAQQAQADAEAAKEHYDELAEQLTGVAQESTLTQGVQDIREDISHIDIDTSDLAKQGTNPNATNTAILEAIQQGGSPAEALETEVETGKAEIATAIESKGGTASTAMSLTGLAQAIDSIQVPTLLRLNAITFENSANNKVIDMGGIEVLYANGVIFQSFGSVEEIRNFPQMPNLNNINSWFNGCSSLKRVDLTGIDTSACTIFNALFSSCGTIENVDISMLDTSSCTSVNSLFNGCTSLKTVNIRNFHFAGYVYYIFYNTPLLESVDMIDTDASKITSISGFFGIMNDLTTFVGGETYQNVVDNNICIMKGLNISWNTSLSLVPNIDQASLRAIINGLADRTGQSALTLSGLGAGNLTKLSAEDIAVATAKNWNITA